ncbi:MAG: amidohydrolase family protein [Planctomycetota bacterium]|nr:amidohydrolase family protein [Planctomycetota bacterium]
MLESQRTRREFLVQSALAGTMLTAGIIPARNSEAAPRPNAAPAAPKIPVIDTHTHFYDPTRPEGVPWPGRDDKLLYRPVLPAEYRRLTESLGVVGTVVVEASSRLEDNQWLLDLAKRESIIVGVVGNLEPGSEKFAENLDRFAANPLYRGIRIGHGLLKQRLSEQRFLDDLRRFASLGLTLDINGGPDMLPDIARLATKLEKLKIVVNHLANVRIDGKAPPTEWQQGMSAAAAGPNVWCKVSALVEGASRPDEQSPSELGYYQPVLEVAWETFGEERLVYGSNWPVSARFGSYASVQKLALEFAQKHGADATRRILHDNAKTAYSRT